MKIVDGRLIHNDADIGTMDDIRCDEGGMTVLPLNMYVPIEMMSEETLGVYQQWIELHKDDVPPVVEPSVTVPTPEERIKALEDAMIILMG
jgi:hypothetical protein